VAQPVDRTFTDLLEAAPDAMICVDSQGRIAAVNAQAEKLFDHPRTDLTGQPIEMLIPEATRARVPGTGTGTWPSRGPGRWARA
jgi:PAS domain S-box-containing protein